MPAILDTVRDMFPNRPRPDGQQENLDLTAKVTQDFQAEIAFQTASDAAKSAVDAHRDLVELRKHLAGMLSPSYDLIELQINYGETPERLWHFNPGWVLTGITLLPGVTAAGAIHNPNLLFIYGMDITGSVLAIPFSTTSTNTIFEMPVSGNMNVRFAVQAASPGAMLIVPRALLRFQNWANGLPLLGGNQ